MCFTDSDIELSIVCLLVFHVVYDVFAPVEDYAEFDTNVSFGQRLIK